MPRPRSVLMLCETFPPESDVGGLRGAMFCKYLPEFGWRPLAYIRKRPIDDPEYLPTMPVAGLPEGVEVASFEFGQRDEWRALERRGLNGKARDFAFPDLAHPPGIVEQWLSDAEKQLSGVEFDTVWGTSPSLGCLTVARSIARRRSVPWVADFRDIDEQDEHMGWRSRLYYARCLARRVAIVRSAAAVTTVSGHHARVLARRLGRAVVVVPNGFDPDMFEGPQPPAPHRFSIVYVGRILSAFLRDPRLLFEGADLAVARGWIAESDLEIQFYGSDPLLLKELARPYACRRRVAALPRIPYDAVPETLRSACILLVLTNTGRSGIITTKVFEYLAARRPILCVPDEGGDLTALLRSSSGGLTCGSAEAVAAALRRWYEEWRATGTIRWPGDEGEIAKFSRRRGAQQLAALLESACDGCHGQQTPHTLA